MSKKDKPCLMDKERNPYTKLCVRKCNEDEKRIQDDANKKFMCKKIGKRELKKNELALAEQKSAPKIADVKEPLSSDASLNSEGEELIEEADEYDEVEKYDEGEGEHLEELNELLPSVPVKNKKNPCDERDEKKDELKTLTREFRIKVKECEESLHGSFIEKYFTIKNGTNLTHYSLLEGLFNYYTEEKKKDINFILTFQQFIDKFPRDTSVNTTNFKKQHIFEALCRLLLLFDYDKGELGYEKTFIDSFENDMKGIGKKNNRNDILDLKVNEASKGGIVDILFKTNISIKAEEEEKMSACEIIYAKTDNDTPVVGDKDIKIPTTIMIQNKYFDKEKSNIDKYDVTRMYALAGDPKMKNAGEHKIILMVNNAESLSSNLLKSKQQFKDVIHKIYGVVQIDTWFQYMLYDLFKNKDKTIDGYISYVVDSKTNDNPPKPVMNPRFHQLLITQSTMKYIEQGNKKFIWGAVPRSGKSFMVADLVDKRKETGNDIVIILGAKTETEQQFIEMFTDYSNFDDYAIITPDKLWKTGSRKIYILSQEWFKAGKTKLKNKKQNKTDYVFDTKKLKLIEPLIKEGKKIDIFFDEIHKGGSSDNSMSILQSFINSKLIIDIFVMVTATFAKPTGKYETFMESKPTKIIQWSYNDQQDMKQVIDETKKQMMINSRNEFEEQVVMEELFADYQARYGLQYLSVLSSEYEKYPELVLITPQILQPNKELFKNQTNDIRNVFFDNLKCDACVSGKSVDHYKTPANIFNDELPVTNLLNYIGEKIYNSFKNDFKYPISSPHTELWFLPDKNLYNDDCSDTCKKVDEIHQLEEDMQGGGLGDNDEDEDEEDSDADEVEEGEDEEDSDADEVEEGEEEEVGEDEEVKEGEEEGERDELNEEESANKESINEKNNSIPNIEPLTRGLAIKIVNSTQYFSNYNVFIVHNTDLKYLKLSLVNQKDIFKGFGDRIRLYDNKKLSLKDQIKLFEKKTYKLGRSLIILTGAKLRLGISLTCADIAFNFDNIKSVDNNYQTMFRVLTEREKPTMKKYGYYLDFNMSRSIDFLYQYNAVYGDKNDKKTLEESVKNLQTLLFSFNYNGLNLITNNTNKELGIYNELIEKLSLSQDEYVKYWTKDKNLVSLIQKGLAQSIHKEELKQLGKILNLSIIKKLKKKNIKLKIGEARKKMEKEISDVEDDDTKSAEYKDGYKKGYNEGSADKKNNQEHIKPVTSVEKDTEYDQGRVDGYSKGYADGYNDKYEDEDDIVTNDIVIEFLSNSIPSIISLLALFSQQNELDCSSIEDCLKKSKEQIEGFYELCKCSNINESNIIDCFYNSPKNIDGKYVDSKHEELKKDLISVLSIIINEINSNELVRHALELKFDIILKEMKGYTGALILVMNSEEIKKLIEDNLMIKKEEKNKFGEVFTPPALINEMLDKLPAEVWSNPELKWLDPANGIGNFPMIVYERLMNGFINKDTGKKIEGLEKSFPDKGERSNHILTKMLFMAEINPKNVKISKKIFGDNANIVCGDFLSGSWKTDEKFEGIDVFDVIIGNPPFNSDQEFYKKKGGGDSLWPKFVKISIQLLKKNGYLVFVHPAAWRKPESEKSKTNGMFNLMAHENQIEYLEIHNTKDGKKTFNAGTRYDWYVIQKTTIHKNTKIKDENGKEHMINLKKWFFLPNYDFEIIEPLLTQNDKHVNLIHGGQFETRQPWVCEEKGERICEKTDKKKLPSQIKQNFIHPLIHTTPQGEPRYYYSSTQTPPVTKLIPMFGVSKVIFGDSGINNVIVDLDGKFGMTQHSMGISISSSKEAEELKQTLESDKFKEVLSALSFGNYGIDWRIFTYFKPDFYKDFLKDTIHDRVSSEKSQKSSPVEDITLSKALVPEIKSPPVPVIKIGKKKNLGKEPSIASGATKLLPPPAKEVLEKTGGKTKKKGSKTKIKTFKKSTKKIKRIRYKKTTIRKK